MDELRISNSVRTADWISTEFANQNDPATFYSDGAEQASGTWFAQTYSGTFSTQNHNLTLSGNLQWDAGTISAGSSTITVAGNTDISNGAVTAGLSDYATVIIQTQPTPTPSPSPGDGTTGTSPTITDLQAPAPVITAPTRVQVNQEFELSAESSTDNVKIVSYSWDLDDHTTSTKSKLTYSYQEINRYPIKLTIKDAAGNSATASQNLDIVPPKPQLIKADSDQTQVSLEGKAYPDCEIIVTLHSEPYQTITKTDTQGKFSSTFNFQDTKLTYGDHKIVLIAQKKISDQLTLKSDPQEYNAYFNLTSDGDLKIKIKQLEKRERIIIITSIICFILLAFFIIILLTNKKILNRIIIFRSKEAK